MTRISIDLSRDGRHWRLELSVNGEIEPRNVFACSEALNPLVFSLERAELEANRIVAASHGDVRTFPSDVSIRMPSGRTLTFTLTRLQQAETSEPKL